MAQLLPVGSAPNQTLSVSLQINGTTVGLTLNVYWNRVGGFWVCDVFDQSGNAVVLSLPLTTGDWPGANIMSPFDYKQIGTWFVINQNGSSFDLPNNLNLGNGFVVLVDNN